MSEPHPPEPHALAAAFGVGLPRGLTLVTSTLASHIWRLETERGSWAVKQHAWTADIARDLVVFDLENCAADAGVPLPRPVSTVEGRPSAVVDDASGTAVTVRMWPWVDLKLVSQPTERRILQELGTALARLHCLPATPDPRPLHPYYWQPPADEVWESLHASAVGVEPAWGAALAARTDDLRALAAFARDHPPAGRTAWCHFDLTEANFRLDPHGRLVIIDWDDANLGDPDRELGWAVATWCDTSSVGELVDSYVEHGGPGRIDHVGALALAACIHVQWVASAAGLALAGQATWLERLLARPLTLDGLRSLAQSAS